MKKEKTGFNLETPIKFVCNHMVGENHKPVHRRIVGLFVMAFGAGLMFGTKEFCHVKVVEFFSDMSGGLIHAFGAIPILKKYID